MADDVTSTATVKADSSQAKSEVQSLSQVFGKLWSDVKTGAELGVGSASQLFGNLKTAVTSGDFGTAITGIRTAFSQFGADMRGMKEIGGSVFTDLARGIGLLGPAAKEGEQAVAGGLLTAIKTVGTVGVAAVGGLVAAVAAVAAPIVGAGLAAWEMTKRFADAGDEFLTLSRQTGASVEALSTWKYIGAQTGTSAEAIANAVFKMGINVEKGGKQTEVALKGIGISSKELKDLAPEEQFNRIMAGLAQLPDASQRAAAGVAIFGKGFKSIAQLTEEDLAGMTIAARQFGLVMSQEMAEQGDRLGDSLNDVGQIMTGLRNIVGATLLPVFNNLVDVFKGGLIVAIQILKDAFRPMMASWAQTGQAVEEFSRSGTLATTVMRVIVNVVGFMIDAFAGVLRTVADISDSWYTLRKVGNDLLIGFGKVVAGILEGSLAIAQGMAKITPGPAGRAFAEAADAISGKLKQVRGDMAGLSNDNQVLDARQKAISTTLRGTADSLNAGSKAARENAANTQLAGIEAFKAKGHVKGLGDDLDLTTDKLTGVAKKMDEWKKSTAEMEAEIQLAIKNGVPMQQIIEMYGKKAEEAAKQGRVFGLDVSAGVAMVADTLIAKDIGRLYAEIKSKVENATFGIQKSLGEWAEKQVEVTEETIKAAKVYGDFQEKTALDSATGTQKRLINIEKERKAALDSIKGIGFEQTAARKEVDAYYDHQAEKARGTADTIVERMRDAGVKTTTDRAQEVADFRRDYDQMLASGQFTTQELYAAWKKWHDASKQLNGDFSTSFLGTLDTIAAGFQQLSQIAGSSFSNTAKAIGTAIATMKVGVSSAEGFTDTLAGMQDGSIKTGAGVAALASNTMGMIGSMQQATDHATRASNAIHGMAQGAAIGTAIMPGWGTAVGAAVGLVWGAIKGVPDWSKLTNEIQRDFATNISKPLADAIAETSKQVGDRSTAVMMHLSEVLKEAGGVTVSNFATWAQKTHDLFSFIERGQLGVADASKQLNEVFPQLAKVILTSNQLASQSFTDLIELDKKFGTNSQAVAEFVAAESNKLVHGLSGILGSFAKDTEALVKSAATMSADDIATATGDMQTRFDRLSRITLSTFNTMIAQGHSSAEAIDSLAGPMDALIKSHDALHLAGNGAYDQLSRLHTLITNNKPLLESLAGTNEMMVALGNLGSKDEQAFADLRAEGLQTFKQMTAAGFTQQEAEQQMKPLLESIIKLHNERGIAIDDETQAMIDQARQDGVLSQQEQSTNQILQQGLTALIKAVGGDLPAAWQKAAGSADDFANRGVNAANNVGGTVARTTVPSVDGVTDRLNKTPWETYQSRAQIAAQNAAGAIGGVGGAAQNTANTVAGSTGAFDRWAGIAVQRARDVQGAIDRVNFGESPGGLKEFVPMLTAAGKEFENFGGKAVARLRDVRSHVDSLSGVHADIGIAGVGGRMAGIGRAGGTTIFNVHVDATQSVITRKEHVRELAGDVGDAIADQYFRGVKAKVTSAS